MLSTVQKSRCVSALRRYSNALFQQTIGFPSPAPASRDKVPRPSRTHRSIARQDIFGAETHNSAKKDDQSQAQQGFLSQLIIPSPFPWLSSRWMVDGDSGNLVSPLMRVASQMTRRLAALGCRRLPLLG